MSFFTEFICGSGPKQLCSCFTQDYFDLELIIQRLYNEYQKGGLQVSLEKREYLLFNLNAKFLVMINDDVQINQLEKFKYLAACIDKKSLEQREIK